MSKQSDDQRGDLFKALTGRVEDTPPPPASAPASAAPPPQPAPRTPKVRCTVDLSDPANPAGWQEVRRELRRGWAPRPGDRPRD